MANNPTIDPSPPTSTPKCPGNSEWNSRYKFCQNPVVCPTGGYDRKAKQCITPPNNLCSKEQGNFNSATNKCETLVNPTCTQGNFNSTTKKCELSIEPTCTQGNFNSATNKCETLVNPTCPNGTYYSENLKGCYVNPNCTDPDNFRWDNTLGVCKYDRIKNTDCASGVYNKNTGLCYGSCPSGYETSGDKCIPQKKFEDGVYRIRGNHNNEDGKSRNYCYVDKYNDQPINCNKGNQKNSTNTNKYTIKNEPNGNYSIRTWGGGFGSFCSDKGDGLRCTSQIYNKDSASQSFEIIPIPDKPKFHHIKTGGKFCADEGAGGIICNRTVPGAWEVFKFDK